VSHKLVRVERDLFATVCAEMEARMLVASCDRSQVWTHEQNKSNWNRTVCKHHKSPSNEETRESNDNAALRILSFKGNRHGFGDEFLLLHLIIVSVIGVSCNHSLLREDA
jgi:hypothetical protein